MGEIKQKNVDNLKLENKIKGFEKVINEKKGEIDNLNFMINKLYNKNNNNRNNTILNKNEILKLNIELSDKDKKI